MDLDNLQNLLERASQQLPDKVPRIIEVEGLNFIKKNFRDQAFTDSSKTKWAKRKKEDNLGRDKTRYTTDRVGSRGSLTKFGQRELGRAILVGHNTGGNKLANSFRSRRDRRKVVWYTYKAYGQKHNEGEGNLPQRQFMGKSQYLDNKIKDKLKREMDKLMRD